MTKWLWLVLVVSLAAVLPASAQVNGGHYPNGVEGIKAGSVPPPGLWLRTYIFNYSASTMNDADGDEIPIGFKVNVWAVAPRLVWITQQKWLGADVGFDIMLPVISTDLKIRALELENKKTGLGDLYFSPLILAWHGPRHDAAFAVSLFAPTGQWKATDPASPGKKYWTCMLTGGYTGYFDQAKQWSGSILGRYEIHGTHREMDLKPGNDFHFEWGIAKAVQPTLEIGLVGYAQFQMTEDSGDDADWDTSDKDRAYAVGPEFQKVFPKPMFIWQLRALYEFGAKDRSQGWMIATTLTKKL